MKYKVGYKYRFYPTDAQRDLLARTFGCCRFIYNRMLNFRTESWHNQHRANFATTCKALTKTKALPEYSWLKDVSSVALQQSLRHLDRAFKNFFEGHTKYPTFKKKYAKQSATFTQLAFTFNPGTRKLILAKMHDPLKIKWSRKLPFVPVTVTISKDNAGRYFVTFHGEIEKHPLPENQNSVGIDMGLNHFAVTSDGDIIDNPRHLRNYQNRLKFLQRRLSRQTKKSKHWQRTKHQIAKLYAKIADCRQDFLHKFTTDLVHHYGHIITEDLNVKGMMAASKPKQDKHGRYLHNGRSTKAGLNRSIGDASWGTAFRQLGYKSTWYGRTYTQINRFFPSSKRCHVCGHIYKDLDQSTRYWTCPQCSTFHDRDVNASFNIKAVGLTVLAFGQGVRLSKGSSILAEAASCEGTTR